MLEINGHVCPFCNGQDLLHYSVPAHDAASKTVSIVECRTCEAGWQWPLQRTEQQSVVEFENAYTEHGEGTYFDPLKRDAVAHCQCEFLVKIFQTPGRQLDIGCGDGNFARHMASRGWDVIGLDPALLSLVTEDHSPGQLRLQPGSMTDLPEQQFFDLITLMDVIEHVEKPNQLVAEAATRLAPGCMLVVETGNYQSAGRVHSRGTWWNYQIDHRWYFAPPQLRELMTDAGLYKVELADRVLRPWWKGQPDISPPKLSTLFKNIAKNPHQLMTTLDCHQELVRGSKNWRGWAGLEIMTMTGRMPNEFNNKRDRLRHYSDDRDQGKGAALTAGH